MAVPVPDTAESSVMTPIPPDPDTPDLVAALADRVEAAGVLVAAGADVNAQDAREDSPWLVTGVTGSVAMMRALLPGAGT